MEKRIKDLQQAVCTSVIVDTKEIRKLFDALPKNWRKLALRMLEAAKLEMPLLEEEIEKLNFTLQKQ